MPGAELEVARRFYEAFNRRDVEAMAAMASEDCATYLLRSQFEDHGYRGPEGVREAAAAAFADWDELVLDQPRFREGIVMSCKLHAVSALGGVPLETDFALLFRIRDGLAELGRAYSDPAEALSAAGISDALS